MNKTNSCNVPEHLNKEFFTGVLGKGLKSKNVNITELSFSSGSDSGDNYLSNIYRIAITYCSEDSTSPKQIFLIAKCVPDCSGERSFLTDMNIFNKEEHMYMNVLPQLERNLNGVKLMPQCYHATQEPTSTFILEDMKALGYNMADRINGLDEEHCKIVLTKLGQYHAASMLLLNKYLSVRDGNLLRRGIFSSLNLQRENLAKHIQRNLNMVIDNISDLLEYTAITENLRNFDVRQFLDGVLECIRDSPENLTVLSHGDMWVNNFLFKYNAENIPTDMVLIDFQGSAFSSLGLDINYFFGTSPILSVLKNKKAELIETCYYAAFSDVLKDNGFTNIPSFRDIKAEIQKKENYGFFITLFILPLISMSKEDCVDISLERLRKEKVKISAFATKRFIETVKYVLKEYYNSKDGVSSA